MDTQVSMSNENTTVIKAWNTVLFDKFCRFKHILTEGLSAHSDEALARCDYPLGSHVLDVGCGFGDSACAIARKIGPMGKVVGVDCAERFVAAAEQAAKADGVRNASFIVADVQSDDLHGPYDFAFSRFGTMFFTSPGAAMRNIRKALAPGGELTMIVWRRREENPWIYEAELRVRKIVPIVSHDETDQVHCGPGPFSMADADMVSGILRGSGFSRIRFERFDADICVGRDLREAIEFAMALGPAGEIIRLAGDEGEKRRPGVIAALSEALAPYVRGDGVIAPSSTWFVRATRI